MWNNLFKSVNMLQKGMSAAWQRNAVLRHNLANAETPGFKGYDVEFESVLQSALEYNGFSGKKTRERHLDIGAAPDFDGVTPVAVRNEGTSMRMDGNNVDVEAENVKLAQNSLKYNTMLAKLNSELSRIKMAISEGR